MACICSDLLVVVIALEARVSCTVDGLRRVDLVLGLQWRCRSGLDTGSVGILPLLLAVESVVGIVELLVGLGLGRLDRGSSVDDASGRVLCPVRLQAWLHLGVVCELLRQMDSLDWQLRVQLVIPGSK